jgi:hypothetical protein
MFAESWAVSIRPFAFSLASETIDFASVLASERVLAASSRSALAFALIVRISAAGPTNSTYFLCSAVASSRAFNFD